MNKFHAKPIDADGHHFDSTKEYRRYRELLLLQQAGQITSLEVHPVYQIKVNGFIVCQYEADFRYKEYGEIVVEDVKGLKKGSAYAVFKLKSKLMLAVHGIEIVEI